MQRQMGDFSVTAAGRMEQEVPKIPAAVFKGRNVWISPENPVADGIQGPHRDATCEFALPDGKTATFKRRDLWVLKMRLDTALHESKGKPVEMKMNEFSFKGLNVGDLIFLQEALDEHPDREWRAPTHAQHVQDGHEAMEPR